MCLMLSVASHWYYNRRVLVQNEGEGGSDSDDDGEERGASERGKGDEDSDRDSTDSDTDGDGSRQGSGRGLYWRATYPAFEHRRLPAIAWSYLTRPVPWLGAASRPVSEDDHSHSARIRDARGNGRFRKRRKRREGSFADD